MLRVLFVLILPSLPSFFGQVGNTDAEGRLLLADAIVEADCADPLGSDGAATGSADGDVTATSGGGLGISSGDGHLIVDCATLTGAARVATGSEIGACFSNIPSLARELQVCWTRGSRECVLLRASCHLIGGHLSLSFPSPLLSLSLSLFLSATCTSYVRHVTTMALRGKDVSWEDGVRDPLWAQPLARLYRSEIEVRHERAKPPVRASPSVRLVRTSHA